jgi:NADP-dependent 3-hydroxy acid dehydrogenase YdfG
MRTKPTANRAWSYKRLHFFLRVSDKIRDEAAAHRILADVRPDILTLNAGAKPPMGRLDQMSWADFTVPWEHDVKAGLHWLQGALNLPLKPGSRVLVVSSGAAVEGSPMSGGYGGAKRMLRSQGRLSLLAPCAIASAWFSDPIYPRARWA